MTLIKKYKYSFFIFIIIVISFGGIFFVFSNFVKAEANSEPTNNSVE